MPELPNRCDVAPDRGRDTAGRGSSSTYIPQLKDFGRSQLVDGSAVGST